MGQSAGAHEIDASFRYGLYYFISSCLVWRTKGIQAVEIDSNTS